MFISGIPFPSVGKSGTDEGIRTSIFESAWAQSPAMSLNHWLNKVPIDWIEGVDVAVMCHLVLFGMMKLVQICWCWRLNALAEWHVSWNLQEPPSTKNLKTRLVEWITDLSKLSLTWLGWVMLLVKVQIAPEYNPSVWQSETGLVFTSQVIVG